MHLDVTDHAGFTAFLDEVEREVGPIDVLVNNAGIMPLVLARRGADATTVPQLAINLAAVIHGTREAMRRMKPRAQRATSSTSRRSRARSASPAARRTARRSTPWSG